MALAGWLALDAGWLQAKAYLAQYLLSQAWDEARSSGSIRRPWPWADTYPVARLRIAALSIDQIVLAGDSGPTLAFGPGWAEASAPANEPGTTVISGHRDTHFSFLRVLQAGDELELESSSGAQRYRVVDTRVADARHEQIGLADDSSLLLVTCWPFDAIVPGGPMRYVVRALPLSVGSATAAVESSARVPDA
jgi:sortase A